MGHQFLPPKSRSIFSLTASCSPGKTWPYSSSVVEIRLCPSLVCTAFGLTPADRRLDAIVWRVEYGEKESGNPATFSIRLHSFLRVHCANGEPSVAEGVGVCLQSLAHAMTPDNFTDAVLSLARRAVKRL